MDKILILDFGSQFTQLIARRVREAGVYCEIQPYNRTDEQVKEFAPKGIILSGGPASTLDNDSPRAPEAVFDLGVPIFTICYGQQTMCVQLGGIVEGGHTRGIRPRNDRNQEGQRIFTAASGRSIRASKCG